MAGRGFLKEEIQVIARRFFEREISIRELRLLPYIDFVIKNYQKIEINKININQEERAIISEWRKKGYLEGGASELVITKEFYNVMQEILWLGYVAIDL